MNTKSKLLTLVAICFTSLSMPAQSNPDIAKLQGIKAEVESNTQFIYESWDMDNAHFGKAAMMYSKLDGKFTETTLYLSYYYGLSKKKRKKYQNDCISKLVDLATLSSEYSAYLRDNHDNAKLKTRGNDLINKLAGTVQTGSQIKKLAEEVVGWFKEKGDAERDDIIAQLTGLKLKSWAEYGEPLSMPPPQD
jgi:hypothetical protein